MGIANSQWTLVILTTGYVHRGNLQRFAETEAQKLPSLESNLDLHSHACGEYVLQELQSGVAPSAVVEGLLREYPVVSISSASTLPGVGSSRLTLGYFTRRLGSMDAPGGEDG